MPRSAPAALFVNARSRRGRAWFTRVHEALEQAEIPLERVATLRRGMDLKEEIGRAIEAGCESILVGGGDGTLRAAAQALAGSSKTLGVLPMGTGNAFARDLGIRTDVRHAVDVIRDGHIRLVDLGSANGEVFLNVATVGLSSLVASRLRTQAKSLLGPLAYAAPLLQALRVIRPFSVELELDGRRERLEAYQVVVGNGRYHAGPFLLADHADLSTGEFVIYAVSTEKGTLLRYLVALLFGRHVDLPEVKVWRAPAARLATTPRRRVVLDGEVRGKTPVEFQVISRGLRVFAPQTEENRV